MRRTGLSTTERGRYLLSLIDFTSGIISGLIAIVTWEVGQYTRERLLRWRWPLAVQYAPPRYANPVPAEHFWLAFSLRNRTKTSVSLNVYLEDGIDSVSIDPDCVQRLGQDQRLSPQGITLAAGEGAQFRYYARMTKIGELNCSLHFEAYVGGGERPIIIGPFPSARILRSQ